MGERIWRIQAAVYGFTCGGTGALLTHLLSALPVSMKALVALTFVIVMSFALMIVAIFAPASPALADQAAPTQGEG